jgi:hypothetical protein
VADEYVTLFDDFPESSAPGVVGSLFVTPVTGPGKIDGCRGVAQ